MKNHIPFCEKSHFLLAWRVVVLCCPFFIHPQKKVQKKIRCYREKHHFILIVLIITSSHLLLKNLSKRWILNLQLKSATQQAMPNAQNDRYINHPFFITIHTGKTTIHTLAPQFIYVSPENSACLCKLRKGVLA